MGYRPVPIARESVITKAAEEIRRLIHEERLRPDDPLPPETQLSQMLNISRNSVREALRILDGLGFVEKQPGRRVVVRLAHHGAIRRRVDPVSLDQAVPVAYRVRLAIEERCAELLAESASEATVADLDSHLGSLRDALKRRDLTAAAHAHVAFHQALVSATRNPVLASMYAPLGFVVDEMSRQGRGTFRHGRQVELHAAIVDGVRARDPRAAALAVRRHFRAVAPLVEFMAKNVRAAKGDRT